MAKKLSYNEVKLGFEEVGYKLLSKKYINNSTRLMFICPEGHKHSMSWNNFRSGRRCIYCIGSPIPSMDFIRESFMKNNYILVANKYKGNHGKLEYICPNDHHHNMSWQNWRAGKRCPTCFNSRRGGHCRLNIKQVKSSFEVEGYELLSKSYKNAYQKLKFICPKGHKYQITWAHWSQGQRCVICRNISFSGSGNPNWRGGIMYEPYCYDWTVMYKDYIKHRDNYMCLNPACRKNSARLSVHHINYDKKDCREINLITLCNSCNARANYDRRWHGAWYSAIIEKRYRRNINNDK